MIKSYPKERDKPKPVEVMPVSSYRTYSLKKAGKKNKYKATKIYVNGIRFDSKLEGRVYEDLLFQLNQGLLIEIKRQVKIPLEVNGVLICTYICDFRVVDKHGQVKYVEAKGMVLPVYAIKKKLFLALLPYIENGATFEEVRA